MMRFIIYYDKEISRLGSILIKSVQDKWDGIAIEIIKSIRGIEGRMKSGGCFDNAIFLFLIYSKSRLIELIHFNHLIDDKKIILVVPDESEETMRLSIQLCPRYIAKISDNYNDLHLVLGKMLKDHSSG